SPMSIDYEVAVPLTLTVPDLERRTAKRFRFSLMMPATFGRGDAMMLDIGSGGARLRHFMVHARGSDVRLSFSYAHHRFSVTARVLASRVVGLGNGPRGATTYDSRVAFVDCSADTLESLGAITDQIETDRLRTWVANAAGDHPSPLHEA